MLQQRFFSALSHHLCPKLETHLILRHISSFETDLDRWQRRCERLTQLQRRICFPPLDAITVNGEDIKLPLLAVEPTRTPSQQELEYLVGFFDGDGCVTLSRRTGAVQLAISQNIDSAEVLLRFRSMLGGSISRHSASTGSRKAALQWRVYGSKMIAAAETLSRVPSMKQAQLLMATKGCFAETDRASVMEDLQMLKGSQHVPEQWNQCSWPYFAGLFDADGCITVRPSSAGLRLSLEQVNPCVLEHLLRFLHENQLRTWSLYRRASCSSLACTNRQDCKQTLERVLANGLLAKRQQAELGLTLTGDNRLQIRDAISSLHGWQSRYRRLDSAGIVRAQEIHRSYQRLRRLSGPEHASMLSQIEELRAKHILQKLISRCDLLRKDMRQSLREGGQVASSTTTSVGTTSGMCSSSRYPCSPAKWTDAWQSTA